MRKVRSVSRGSSQRNATTQFTRTSLMKAARDGHTKCVDALIKKGADVNAYDENLSTALIRAVDKGRVQCVERLLKAGADVNLTNMYGINALIAASYEGHVDCVRVLLEKGASHKAPTRKHSPTWHIATFVLCCSHW